MQTKIKEIILKGFQFPLMQEFAVPLAELIEIIVSDQ